MEFVEFTTITPNTGTAVWTMINPRNVAALVSTAIPLGHEYSIVLKRVTSIITTGGQAFNVDLSMEEVAAMLKDS